ncbi:LuxR family maltose regulon positive regulatory protein [Actinoplanes lutulentus]|uniref:LuxR family maltose regulon positive regulatory protein n=1 Tax=Actinoplanes lutulentus TaxID=1287878 RepID=A0A327ZDH5_9ACTN|nr:LuxR C-terminal-related transcriptional regulator [Actinoplanes lutulentus]MBB2941294.1 LuxR family maltose regulon positive regulatory protein [Actinoplanes lutulentus]RAK36786.1 LuxR family maltose regulon positive regulatory protein [Actinoplanes lutulentus]
MSTELIADLPGGSGFDADSSLLDSKFMVPAAPPFMVARPALLARMTEGVQGPVTLVTGLAGSGKTQLLATWVTSGAVDWPIAWISLETGDEQPSAFWTYVIEGLRRAGVAVPAVPGGTAGRAVISRLAAAIDEQPAPVVLILDNASQLPGREWALGLDFLISHARQLRVVLTGRWDPPLPLYRYRLAGQLHELRTADLAFSSDEAAELMVLHGVDLGAAELAKLLEHTEGWAAGIRLCACALQNSPDVKRLVDTISGDESTIADYFVGEVLRLQTPEVRRFLLETSVLDTFTPALAAAVTDRSDASRLLSTLTRENAFIQPVGTGSDLYRYHRLFAELLRAQLAWAEPDEVPMLHTRAAAWLSEQGRLVEAVGHAAQAGDWGSAAGMVVEDYAVGRLVIEGGSGRLGRLFAGMPEHMELPEAVMVQAAIAYGDRRPDRAADLLAYAGKLLAVHGSTCGDGLTLTGFLVQILLLADGPEPERVSELVAVAETFLAVAPPERLARHPELRVLLRTAEGSALNSMGSVDAAVDVLTDAAASIVPGCDVVRIGSLAQLALIEAYRGRLSRAEHTARQALDLAAEAGMGRTERPGVAEVALAWVALERYDIEAADRHLRAAQPLCGPDSGAPAMLGYAVVRARRLHTRGELRAAVNTLRAAEVAAAEMTAPRWLTREVLLGQARLLIAGGHPDHAAELLGRCPETSSPDVAVVHAALAMRRGDTRNAYDLARTTADAVGVPAPVALDAWLLLAVVAAQGEDASGAREALRRALRVAGAENQRRPVHQAWGQLRRLLRDDERLAVQFGALGVTPVPSQAGASAAVADAEPVVVEALSKRELDVLRGMAAMLPTEEIAATLYVSVNTVKTHVRSILRKLSASRRNEAVRRARSLKLI